MTELTFVFLGLVAGVGITIYGARVVWRDVILRDGSGSAVIRMTASGSGYMAFAPLAPDLSIDDALKELDRRVRETIERIGKVRNDITHEVRDRKAADSNLIESFGQVITNRAETERKRAVQGLRIEACGFILLTIVHSRCRLCRQRSIALIGRITGDGQANRLIPRYSRLPQSNPILIKRLPVPRLIQSHHRTIRIASEDADSTSVAWSQPVIATPKTPA